MANKRLIDANALCESFEKAAYKCEYIEDMVFHLDYILDEITGADEVDAVEVVHGKWTPNFEYDFDRGEHRLVGYHCDQCGIWTLKKNNYCPNCGAKMDGGNEDAGTARGGNDR